MHSSSKRGRKFHHKSRYGCVPCKQRRIKCDERKPLCGNCAQRRVECSFKYFAPATTSQQLTTTASNPSRALTPSIPPQISQTRTGLIFCRSNTRDLELFCHFQAYTAPALSPHVAIQDILRDAFINLATSYPFVGHGLLSIAYIHLGTLSPATSGKLLTESAFHLNSALPGYLGTIKNITKENSTALFGFAMFVVLFTFANVNEECGVLLQKAQEPSMRTEAIRGLTNSAARVAHSIHNIFGIFWNCQQWISSGPLAISIQRMSPPMLIEPSIRWMRIEDEHLARLSRLWEHDPNTPIAYLHVLSDSLNSLRDTFAMVTQLTALPSDRRDTYSESLPIDLSDIHAQLSAGRLDDIQSVFTWYIRLSPVFIKMIAEGNAYAMVVLAHFAIALDRACSNKWWAHELPQRFVAMSRLVLGEEKLGWIEWPQRVVCQPHGGT
ncbi:hypothetical protein BJY04DRAFT_231213 [Aspergillus karnatakaensis]|uniref:Zn(II)2Cys6 transcription factor n=1 Tax=Aspergillus karnatakaensis TaxID=1810916 RepID=UPI003CCD4E37